MKKHLFLLTLAFGASVSQSQVFADKAAKTHFLSKSSIEDIEATNKTSVVVMDATNGNVQSQVQIKAFKFSSSFMEEHFNENYMESEKYPFSTFKGKLNEKVDVSKDGEYKVTCTGKLEMHGVTQEVTLPGTLKVKGGEVTLTSNFKVKLADYKIKVPSLYVKNIAEEIDVDVTAILKPLKKA
jgi:polyisoprenoid-binding protein YceI